MCLCVYVVCHDDANEITDDDANDVCVCCVFVYLCLCLHVCVCVCVCVLCPSDDVNEPFKMI